MSNVANLTIDQTATGVFQKVGFGQKQVSLKTFQSVGTTTSGVGAATIAIEGSNDGLNWISLGNVNLTLGTAPTTNSLVYGYPWGFYRANVTAISGTGAKVSVYMGM